MQDISACQSLSLRSIRPGKLENRIVFEGNAHEEVDDGQDLEQLTAV